MRFARFVSFSILALGMMASTAFADEPRVFGTTTCAQQFVCSSTSAGDIATIAGNCAVQGLGLALSVADTFNGASLDRDNCTTGQIPISGNSRPTAVKCCTTSTDDQCKMVCQLLVY